MARPITPRAGYEKDAQHVMRLIRAVEIDNHRKEQWRKQVINEARRLVQMLMTPPSDSHQSD